MLHKGPYWGQCMYINDLPKVCQQCNIILYADDTVIFTNGKNAEEVANKLTDVLAKIISWLNQCYLKLNLSKTVYMLFPEGNSFAIKQDIYIFGREITGCFRI